MSITIKDVKSRIRNLDDVTLKMITDLVTYQIRKGPYNKTPGENYISAENFVSEYISQNLNSFDDLKCCLDKHGDGIKGLESFSSEIYDCYFTKRPDFNTIKDFISAKKDISLKTLTDMVAYKISQSSDDKGPEINYITAETFVAQYISQNFKDLAAFKDKLKNFGENLDGVELYADLLYRKFVNP